MERSGVADGYAKLNIEIKKKIIEEYSDSEIESKFQVASWHKEDNLLNWLKNLGT